MTYDVAWPWPTLNYLEVPRRTTKNLNRTAGFWFQHGSRDLPNTNKSANLTTVTRNCVCVSTNDV